MTTKTKSPPAAQLRSTAEIKAAAAARRTGERFTDLEIYRTDARAVANDEPLSVEQAEQLGEILERRGWTWQDFENDTAVLRRVRENADTLDDAKADKHAEKLAAEEHHLVREFSESNDRTNELRQLAYQAEMANRSFQTMRADCKQLVKRNPRLFGEPHEAFAGENTGVAIQDGPRRQSGMAFPR